MKFILILLPFLVSCVSMKTVVLNGQEEAKPIVVEKNEFKENIPEIVLKDCQENLDLLEKISSLKSGEHRNLVVKKIGLPNYEAADYRREQTVLYGKYDKKKNAWCYLGVITYSKNWKVQRVSLFTTKEKFSKLEHIFD